MSIGWYTNRNDHKNSPLSNDEGVYAANFGASRKTKLVLIKSLAIATDMKSTHRSVLYKIERAQNKAQSISVHNLTIQYQARKLSG